MRHCSVTKYALVNREPLQILIQYNWRNTKLYNIYMSCLEFQFKELKINFLVHRPVDNEGSTIRITAIARAPVFYIFYIVYVL